MDTLIYVIIPVGGEYVLGALQILVVLAPAICVLKGYGLFKTNVISLPIIFASVALGFYLMDTHITVQLTHMGFDRYGMSEAERMRNVAPEMKAKATELYAALFGSTSIKAMFALIFGVPYPSISWAVLASAKSVAKAAIKRVHQ